MTDPAVEAAKRANESNGDWPWDTTREAMQEAAREALNPIRELHVEKWNFDDTGGLCKTCRCCWPCDTAKLIYTESELRNE